MSLWLVARDPTTRRSLGSFMLPMHPPSEAPVTATLVCGFEVHMSNTTIDRFLYGSCHTLLINTLEFDYR